jgi:DNA invertase Pin-like site-specific DNA recombinase
MNPEQAVTPDHLKRTAYLYVRQSTLRQVLEHGESARRQYALRQRAVALGWREDQIVVVDGDTAHTAASAAGREGFQQLVIEVGLGHAGLVMGLEVSRLARNCSDWHRLLELCALTDTLIMDDEAMYNANQFNDRLLLGLKGAMSEAELHLIKGRLQGAILSKARRGELKLPLPPGLVYGPDERVLLDPDQQVQQAVKYFFEAFRRAGSAWGTVQVFQREALKFPHRHKAGSGDMQWEELTHTRALAMLRNPRYAGAYAFGRTRIRRTPEGRLNYLRLPIDQWRVLIKNAHPAYLTWEQYQENLERLRTNAQAYGADRKQSPAREGCALLQGLILCGRCGRRMTVRYQQRRGRPVPAYLCQSEGIEHGTPICQCIPGGSLDEAVGKLLVESVTPLSLEVALNVQQELQKRLGEVDHLRQQQVQRARYEADRAQVRYMHVDPNNRLVADTLEADWNNKLRALTQAQEDYEKHRQTDQQKLTEEQRTQVLSLASSFPKLWQSPSTTDKDRKRMARLLLEDVTLMRGQDISVQVRFKGGAARCLNLPLPLNGLEARRTQPQLLNEIDRMLDQFTEGQMAAEFNQRGWRSSLKHPFSAILIRGLCRFHGFKSRQQRLKEKGLLGLHTMAEIIGTKPNLVDYWRQQGLLKGVLLNDKGEYMYERPDPEAVQQIKMRARLKPTEALA